MSRAIRRTRIFAFALVIVASLVAGLTGCAIGPSGPGPLPEKPAGSVESFGDQQPNWGDCGDGMQCADVWAPLDWKEPAGERITLRLMKNPASGGDPEGTLFVNPGGPGASGADYVAGSGGSLFSQDVSEAYDVIGWDPRGVEASSAVSCYDAAEMDEYLFGPGEGADLETGTDAWIAAALEESREFGEACEANTGELLGHVSTNDTVRDLEMLRAIVGDTKLNFLGFSYGTYIGSRYADAYPDRVGKMVLDGAIDPTSDLHDVVREQTRGFEQALHAYVTDCLTRNDCPFNATVDGAMSQISGLLQDVEAEPLMGRGGRLLTVNTMLTAIITPLYSESSWPYLDDLFLDVAAGDASTGLALADMYYDRHEGTYLSNSTEAFSAINCLDYPNTFDPEVMREQAAELIDVAPTIGRYQGYGDIACAQWPVQGVEIRGPVVAEGADPILVVGTTGDPATPYAWAESLAQQLESGVLLTYEGEGHTAYGESACIDAAVDGYLVGGAVPAVGTRCT